MPAERKRRAIVSATLVLTFLLVLGIMDSEHLPKRSAAVFAPRRITAPVILDPGHGGLDGGAVSDEGMPEAPLNLAIALRTRELLRFLGVSVLMTRENDDSLDYDPGQTIRQNKRSDLNARLKLARDHPESPFVSIHLNKYQQERYHGAQVFYSPNNSGSRRLADLLQARLRLLDPENERTARLTPDGVFLMEQIRSPAVTAECGFLSNRREASLLAETQYQIKLAAALCCGCIDYIGSE